MELLQHRTWVNSLYFLHVLLDSYSNMNVLAQSILCLSSQEFETSHDVSDPRPPALYIRVPLS